MKCVVPLDTQGKKDASKLLPCALIWWTFKRELNVCSVWQVCVLILYLQPVELSWGATQVSAPLPPPPLWHHNGVDLFPLSEEITENPKDAFMLEKPSGHHCECSPRFYYFPHIVPFFLHQVVYFYLCHSSLQLFVLLFVYRTKKKESHSDTTLYCSVGARPHTHHQAATIHCAAGNLAVQLHVLDDKVPWADKSFC